MTKFAKRFADEENRGPSNGYKSLSDERGKRRVNRKISAARKRRERAIADIAAFMGD